MNCKSVSVISRPGQGTIGGKTLLAEDRPKSRWRQTQALAKHPQTIHPAYLAPQEKALGAWRAN
jgi:hypothetical protein